MVREVVPVLGVLLVLICGMRTLQAEGVLGGSAMTGSRFWLVAVAAGVALLVRAVRVRRR